MGNLQSRLDQAMANSTSLASRIDALEDEEAAVKRALKHDKLNAITRDTYQNKLLGEVVAQRDQAIANSTSLTSRLEAAQDNILQTLAEQEDMDLKEQERAAERQIYDETLEMLGTAEEILGNTTEFKNKTTAEIDNYVTDTWRNEWS